MRLLVGPTDGVADPEALSDDDLVALYEPPRSPWLRVNMVSSVDGAAFGETGLSAEVNNPVDERVFHLLRRTSDVIVVGAGTARNEGYGPAAVPIVVVSRRADVPETLRDAPPGSVRMATVATAELLDEAGPLSMPRLKEVLGEEHVYVAGETVLDPAVLLGQLHGAGFRTMLSEGGPSLLSDLVAAGVVDELCLTTTPRLLGGSGKRIVSGLPVDVPLDLATLVEEGGTMLARWVVRR